MPAFNARYDQRKILMLPRPTAFALCVVIIMVPLFFIFPYWPIQVVCVLSAIIAFVFFVVTLVIGDDWPFIFCQVETHQSQHALTAEVADDESR